MIPRDALSIIPSPGDLLIDASDVERVTVWLRECTRGDILVITSESSGCGVSTMIRSLESSLSNEIAFFTDEPFGYGLRTILGQKKIILIDPLDEYMADQAKQMKVSSIFDTRPLPIVVTGIRRRVSRAKIDDIFGTVSKRKGVTKLHIPAPPRELAFRILSRLGVQDPGPAWDASKGDFRHCLSTLMMPDTDQRTSVQFVRDSIPDGIPALSKLLAPPGEEITYSDTVRMVDSDINLIMDGVFENYTDGVDQTDFETIEKVLDSLDVCDRLQTSVYSDPSSEYPEISGSLSGVQWMRCHVTTPITKHGTVWAKENHKYTKMKLRKYLTTQGIHPDTIDTIRRIACQRDDTISDRPTFPNSKRLIQAYGSKAVWNATRLWIKTATAAGYTKTRHEDSIL